MNVDMYDGLDAGSSNMSDVGHGHAVGEQHTIIHQDFRLASMQDQEQMSEVEAAEHQDQTGEEEQDESDVS